MACGKGGKEPELTLRGEYLGEDERTFAGDESTVIAGGGDPGDGERVTTADRVAGTEPERFVWRVEDVVADRDTEFGRDNAPARDVVVAVEEEGRVKGAGAGAGGITNAEDETGRLAGMAGGCVSARCGGTFRSRGPTWRAEVDATGACTVYAFVRSRGPAGLAIVNVPDVKEYTCGF